jgi:hypothetical protein
MQKGFYLIDAESDDYFVGRFFRDDEQLIEPMRNLEVGETHWTSEHHGFERFQ